MEWLVYVWSRNGLSVLVMFLCMDIVVRATTDSALTPAEIASDTLRGGTREWIPLEHREYQFVIDADRRLDKGRNAAKDACRSRHADLVTLETEEQLEFVKQHIRSKVRQKGLQLLNEQWWTNGMSLDQEFWVWDTRPPTPVKISAMKRRTVPKLGTHYLALTHSGGWRLKNIPENYKLRYICQRDRKDSPPRSGSTDYKHANLTAADIAENTLELRARLFAEYEPNQHGHDPMPTTDREVIMMEVDLIQIQENVSAENLLVKQNIETIWNDARLTWRPELYGGMQQIRTHITDVWYPGIKTRSSSGQLSEACHNTDPQNLITINATGFVTLDRSCEVMYNCTLQTPAAFPFDHKQCRLMVFIEKDGNALVQMTRNRGDSTLDGGFHRAWRASSLEGKQVDWTGTESTDLNDSLVVAQLTLYLHRNVLYHILTLLVPCLFLAVVLLIILWLPHGSAVKCITTLLVTSSFLLYLVIAGQHTKGRNISFSDMFMIVMSIIGTLALVTQLCTMHLVRRHRKHQPPPPCIERIVARRSHQDRPREKYKDIKSHEMATLAREGACDTDWMMDKLLEEKEIMLEENNLGMTTLGRDAKLNNVAKQQQQQQQHHGRCSAHARDHLYVTLPRPPCPPAIRKQDSYKNTRCVPLNNRTPTVRFETIPKSQVPNGTGKRHPRDNRSPKSRESRNSPVFTDVTNDVHMSVPREPMASAGESFDSGVHSDSKNSPDVTIATNHASRLSQFEKCIVWFDRTVSLVVSITVMFTIVIFIILFAAT